MTSIREVAARSGVSVSTVSRVFNDYADVSAATRERVLEIARLLDYAPTSAARTLVRRRSQLIGVVLSTGEEHPDIHHPFFQGVLVALKHGLGAHGYDLLLFATELPGSGRLGDHSYLRRARQHRVDGIVVMGLQPDDPELEKLVGSAVPVIGVDLEISSDRTSYVTSDNFGGARLAVRHLHAQGHTRIATIAGPQHSKPGADRLLGFRTELRALGLDASPAYEAGGDFYTESGEEAMRRLLALPDPPTAVFAASDLMAVGAIRVAHAAGLRVGRDVAVVGFDDIPLAELVDPPLTTVRQDTVGIGTAAGRALVAQIENPDETPPVLTLPVELVVRSSCGAREGEEVTAA